MKLWGSPTAASMARSAHDDARSFSVITSDNSRLHLELPKRGNGRSRREWMDAISDVIATAPVASADAHPSDRV